MTTVPNQQFTFGTKVADDTDTTGTDTGDWIHRINKAGSYTFRFLEEFPDWIAYWEHFSADKKTSYPCTANTAAEKKDCPGCQSPSEKEAKAAKRYLVNAVRTDGENQGYAHLWKLPAPSLKEALQRNFDKYGTIRDRDYTVYRTDGNSGTSYELEKEDAQPMDLSEFTLRDGNAALLQEWMEAWDADAIEAKNDRREAAKAKRTEEAKSDAVADKAEPSEEEVPDALLSQAERDAKAKASKPKMTLAKDPEPEPEEEVELTPSSIRSMKAEGIVALFDQAGLDLPSDVDKGDRDALAEALIKALTE